MLASHSTKSEAQPIDPVFLEIFWTRVRAAVNEAAKLIVRTSFSTLSTEANDFAVVLTDAQGRSVAENAGSIPSFIGTLPRTVRVVLERFPAQSMRPGDVFVTNNPWEGTGHLNDVCLVKPIFHGAALVSFAATAGHVPDIGGRIRSVDAREVFEEGLHIPVMRLLRAGEPDETLLAMIRGNVRTPEQTVGDIWSQVGAVELVARRIGEMLTEYRIDGIGDVAAELFARSELAMRRAISALPDGVYHYEMQSDGFGERFNFKVAVRVVQDAIELDFTGTSRQQPRAINCVLAYTYAMSAYAIKCLLLPDLPNNDGLFRPIRVIAPEGTLLNPRYPAPVGGRSCTGHYVPTVIFGAMHSVVPERVMAGAGSPVWVANLSGTRKEGQPFATVLFFNGGMGATTAKDGASVMSWPSNISHTPIEIAERDAPLHFKYKTMRSGSGGPGMARGGLGEEVAFVSRHHEPLAIVFLTERLTVPAPGLGGGEAGACGEVLVNGQRVDTRTPQVLEPGDEVVLRTPGGGGFGPSSRRALAAIAMDMQHGYASTPDEPTSLERLQP